VTMEDVKRVAQVFSRSTLCASRSSLQKQSRK
jgi:hypothetical protein